MNGISAGTSNFEQIQRRKPLEDNLVRLFCQFGPNGWKLPALELKAERDRGRQTVALTARAFDLSSDAEVTGAPQPLMDAAASYHHLCASFGEDWKRCLLTMVVDDDGKVTLIQWNFNYQS
jgi:hypothetical protein